MYEIVSYEEVVDRINEDPIYQDEDISMPEDEDGDEIWYVLNPDAQYDKINGPFTKEEAQKEVADAQRQDAFLNKAIAQEEVAAAVAAILGTPSGPPLPEPEPDPEPHLDELLEEYPFEINCYVSRVDTDEEQWHMNLLGVLSEQEASDIQDAIIELVNQIVTCEGLDKPVHKALLRLVKTMKKASDGKRRSAHLEGVQDREEVK